MEDDKNIQPELICEEDLDAVAGGGSTLNRYCPQSCKNLSEIRRGVCSGVTKLSMWCDYYRRTDYNSFYYHSCVMDAFPPYKTTDANAKKPM